MCLTAAERKPVKKEDFWYRCIQPYIHTYGPDSVHMKPNQGLDLRLKQECQRYYEEHYGTREEFIKEFGRSYL
jgi:hypothetical protein